MKKVSYIHFIFLFILSALFSCGEDRTYEYNELTKENQWIYSQMKENYLWGDSIKKPGQKEFFTASTKFFKSLLVAGDKVSFFTDTTSAVSYGFAFATMRDPLGERPSKVYALVLYVEPGSPAHVAGLERGMWISSVGGKALSTSSNSLLLSGGATELVTEYIDYDEEYYWAGTDTISLPAAVEINPEPIVIDTIYNVRDRRVGYILCNNFNGNDFARDVEGIISDYCSANVTDVIIDLRYNTGGSIANAAQFASALVSNASIGTPFCELKGKNSANDTTYCYREQAFGLGDRKVYIIMGSATKGTAQLFAGSLNNTRSMYDLLILGSNGTGANLYTEPVVSPYGFTINPAVAYIYSSSGNKLPTTGVDVDYQLEELYNVMNIQQLGNTQEQMLFNVLYLIVNGSLPNTVAPARAIQIHSLPTNPFTR